MKQPADLSFPYHPYAPILSVGKMVSEWIVEYQNSWGQGRGLENGDLGETSKTGGHWENVYIFMEEISMWGRICFDRSKIRIPSIIEICFAAKILPWTLFRAGLGRECAEVVAKGRGDKEEECGRWEEKQKSGEGAWRKKMLFGQSAGWNAVWFLRRPQPIISRIFSRGCQRYWNWWRGGFLIMIDGTGRENIWLWVTSRIW